jgi:hypothetical protein
MGSTLGLGRKARAERLPAICSSLPGHRPKTGFSPDLKIFSKKHLRSLVLLVSSRSISPLGDFGGLWRDRELFAPLGAGLMADAA